MTNKMQTSKTKRPTTKPIEKPHAGSLREEMSVRNGKPTEAEIRLLAYQKWEAAGSPGGDGAEFWLLAERELLQR